MIPVLLSCGHVVYVSWLSGRVGVEVNHTCTGGSWHGGERVASIVKVLSVDRDELIERSYKAGHSLREVAREHGITRERVRQILKSRGVARRSVRKEVDTRLLDAELQSDTLSLPGRRMTVGRTAVSPSVRGLSPDSRDTNMRSGRLSLATHSKETG